MIKTPAYLEYMRSGDFGALFRRTFSLVCVGILLPLISVCILVSAYLNGIYEDELYSMGESSLRRVAEVAETVQSSMDKIAINLSSAENIRRFMEYRSSDTAYNYDFYKLAGGISEELNKLTSSYIDTIYIRSFKNDYVVMGGGETMSSNLLADKSWLVPLSDISSEYTVSDLGGRLDANGNVILSSYYSYPFEWLTSPEGVIVINYNTTWLESLISSDGKTDFSDFYIVDGAGSVIYNRDPEKLGKAYAALPIADGLAELRTTGGEAGRVYIAHSSFDGLGSRLWTLLLTSLGLLSACVLTAFLVSYIISIRVFKPVRSIIKLKESHSELLQAQINPHFLYNALQRIGFQAMSLTKSDNICSRSIERLSSLFRRMTECGGETTLGRELEFTREYLGIAAPESNGDYEITWDVSDAVTDVSIPKLTIQPIVENCVKHAFDGDAEPPYRINIRAASDSRCVIVCVCDNGVGQSAEWLRETNSALARCEETMRGTSIGLSNVNTRIKLTHGVRYGVSVSESDSGGLKVTIRLPQTRGEEENQ